MIFKLITLLLLLMLTVWQTFGTNVQPTGLKSNFSVKCFGIMQPLLQDIAVKKDKIDQCDETIRNKDNKLADIQGKYDHVQKKLALSEAVVREKERQMEDQYELYSSHRNNSLIKDELLKAYRIQIKAKADQIGHLPKDAKEQKELLDKCQTQVQEKDAQLKQNHLKQEQSAKNMSNNETQVQKLLAEAKETKEQLERYRKNVKAKDEQLEKLQAEIQWNGVKLQELESSLKNSSQQTETQRIENNKTLDRLLAYKLQVESVEIELKAKTKVIDEKQIEINNLQSQLLAANVKLSNYQSQIDIIQSTSCFWFGNSSDIHEIRAPGVSPFEVLCDSHLAGPGWTVIQRRINGSENFYRNWTEYRDGFGSLRGEFFIGMEKLYRLTMAQSYELYVNLESFNNETYYARYADFSVGSESESYTLKLLGKYTGNAGDGLYYSRNRKFSTFDKDNDRDVGNCAKEKHGAWWYDRCGLSNLNGQYMESSNKESAIFWLPANVVSVKSVQMMIRPKSVQYI